MAKRKKRQRKTLGRRPATAVPPAGERRICPSRTADDNAAAAAAPALAAASVGDMPVAAGDGDSDATGPRVAPMSRAVRRTVASAVAALALVFGWFWITTTDISPTTYAVTSWSVQNQPLAVSETQISVRVPPKGVLLFHWPLPDNVDFSRFTCDLTLPRNVQVYLAYHDRRPGGGEQFSTYRLTYRLRRRSDGTAAVDVCFDDVPDLARARAVGLFFQGPRRGKPPTVTVKDAQLHAYPPLVRLVQLCRSLFRYQPLTQRHNNFIETQRIAGRGYLFLAWVAWLLTGGSLIVRRLALGERLNLPLHAGVAALALFVAADMRNCVDYIGHLKHSLTLRLTSKSMDQHLARLESGLPWFLDLLRFLRDEIPAGSTYYMKFRGHPNRDKERVCYYARPARRVRQVAVADYVLLCNLPPTEIAAYRRSPEWRLDRRIRRFIWVFKRVEQP